MASLGQDQVKTALAGTDKIKQMIAMSDQELGALLGYDKKVEAAKKSLLEADALTGKARENFISKLDDRLSPRLDGYDLNWMIKDSKREADPKKTDMGPCC